MNARRGEAGFTLIEAMVALLIVALMAGAIVMLAPGPGRKTRAFAEQFAARISVASEEAIVTNHPHALILNHDGYGFARLEERGWLTIRERSALSFQRWPADVSFRVENAEASQGERVARFDTFGAASPARILIEGAGAGFEIEIDGEGRAHVAPRA